MSTMNGGGAQMEPGSNTYIKPDPDAAAPSPYMDDDDDIYEDAGDLDFTDAGQQLWMTRLPKTLWEVFNKLKDDEEIEIGTVRVEKDPDGTLAGGRVSLMLRDLPQFSREPKEYILQKPKRSTGPSGEIPSTYVFSEKDMPGFKSKIPAVTVEGENQVTQGRSFLYEQHQRELKKRENKKRFEPYSRKAIPKQTALSGVVMNEFSCRPVDNEENNRIQAARWQTEVPKAKLERITLDEMTRGRMIPGGLAAQTATSYLGKNAKAAKRGQDNKTIRMPRNALFDLLLQKFSEYPYWGLKNLRAQVKQPEAYLRQVLEDMAVLIKQGDFAMTWTLKDEYKQKVELSQDRQGAVAPDTGDNLGLDGLSDVPPGESGADSDEDDENENLFEDVAAA